MARLNDPPSHGAEQQQQQHQQQQQPPTHPPPASSSAASTVSDIDALKRRFTRQNRELARTNSAQSLRIRNLETEIARLLAENIALREAAIAAQRDAARQQRQAHVAGEVLAMKERLERKLAEVGVLVQELGGLGKKTARQHDRRSDAQTRASSATEGHASVDEAGAGAGVQSPDQKDWRNRQMLGGGAALINGSTMASGLEPEGRLPPIVEDKLYPRRTMDATEVQEALNDNGSPDIGPPPIAQYDAIGRGSWGEVVELEAVHTATESDGDGPMTGQEPEETREPEDKIVALPYNLETRRRRRTSSLLSEMPTLSVDSSDKEGDAATATSTPALFKSGAKRKLEVSELEEAPGSASKNDGFVYQRRPTMKVATARKSGRFSRPNGILQPGDIIIPAAGEREREHSPQRDATARTGTERRALAPKSSNSPVKKSVSAAGAELKSIKGESGEGISTRPRVSVVRATSTKQHRRAGSKSRNKSDDGSNDKAADADAQPPPQTPFAAVDAVLSPPASGPPSSTQQQQRQQQQQQQQPQHQEAALINSVEDVLNGSVGRASRRARAAVSYAEPNLRDKMRRPGKELVSAVAGIDKARQREASLGGSAGGSAVEAEPGSPLGDRKPTVSRAETDKSATAATDDDALAKHIDRLAIFGAPQRDGSSRRQSAHASKRSSGGGGGGDLDAALVRAQKGGTTTTTTTTTAAATASASGATADRLATRRRSMMI